MSAPRRHGGGSAVLLTDASDAAVSGAAALLPSWRVEVRPSAALLEALDELPAVRALVVATGDPVRLRTLVDGARARRVPVVMACADETARRRAVELQADEWYTVPASSAEIASRVRSAMARAVVSRAELAERVERVEYEELLFDTLAGLPTLPVMLERMRALLKERGALVVLYLRFVRFAKIEEIYGWEKLDAVLETTAAAVREFLDVHAYRATQMLVSFVGDEEFIFFHAPPAAGAGAAPEARVTEAARRLYQHLAERLEAVHGEEIAALFDIYVGSAHLYHDPKVRAERLIYRGIREAAAAARSIEQRERARRATDLKALLHDGSLYIDFDPIVRASDRRVIGYEALARGVPRELRSPEVMFEVAAQADLVWELSRLCRVRALEGARERLGPGQLLFLNVDPHDFADPAFGELAGIDPHAVVIEITERTAITDYPSFRERLRSFRERGFRVAVDDAGSGYAGLGSIANLEPDFIKLDMSLITSIDSNFIKQNLVESMVHFAEEQGAQVIAEGVERPEELETVTRLGVHLAQGFLLHRAPRLEGGVAAPAERAPR